MAAAKHECNNVGKLPAQSSARNRYSVVSLLPVPLMLGCPRTLLTGMPQMTQAQWTLLGICAGATLPSQLPRVSRAGDLHL